MGFSLLPSKPFPYVLTRHRDLPAAEAPTFRLRTIGSRLMLELGDLVKENPARNVFYVVAAGLVGWENLERDGVPFEFKPATGKQVAAGMTIEGGADFACVDALPADVVVELAGAILEANTLDRESAKN